MNLNNKCFVFAISAGIPLKFMGSTCPCYFDIKTYFVFSKFPPMTSNLAWVHSFLWYHAYHKCFTSLPTLCSKLLCKSHFSKIFRETMEKAHFLHKRHSQIIYCQILFILTPKADHIVKRNCCKSFICFAKIFFKISWKMWFA